MKLRKSPIFVLFLMALCLVVHPSPLWAAGTVAVASWDEPQQEVRTVTLTLTSGAGNLVTGVSTDNLYVGTHQGNTKLTQYLKGFYLYSCIVVNSATVPPTATPTILFTDASGNEIDQALLTGISYSANTWKNMGTGSAGYPLITGPVTISASGFGATGKVITLTMMLVR